MREIKVRAWEKNLKEIIPVHNINFERKMINTESAWRLFDEVEIMQYTGLKDKKGIEIYEGDIVTNKTKSFSGNGFSGKNLLMLVEWDQNECFYSLSVYDEDYWGFKKLTKSSAADIEVIGNIYENPELIQVKI